MKYSMIFVLFLTSCSSRSSNAIEELGEEVIKKHEGLEIRLEPIDEKKHAENNPTGVCIWSFNL